MSKEEKPKSEKPYDENKSYPWGNNTGTYKTWLILFAINSIALSVMFLAYIEIPAILGQEHALSNIFEPRETDPTAELSGILLCIAVIVANFVIVIITKTVGKWLTSVERWCREWCPCKWNKPWCCLGRLFCWLVTITKWVTWLVTIVSTVATMVLTVTCNF